MASFDFRLKIIDETRKYLLDEMKHLVSEKHKKVCRVSNYFEDFLVFVYAAIGCVSVSVFASLNGVPVVIASSAVGLNICASITGIKKYKSIIKKKRKRHGKIVSLGKAKLDTIEPLISKAFIDSCISHEKIMSVNNALRKYNEIKKEIKNLQNAVEYTILRNRNVLCQL